MSARRKQLIALSVVLVCVIGMAAYGIVRVSNKTADKENGFDVAMTDTTDKSEDGSKDSDKTEKKEKTDQKSDAKKDDSVKEEDKKEETLPTLDLTKNEAKKSTGRRAVAHQQVLHLLGMQEILQPMVLTVHGNRETVPIPVLTLEIMD